MQGDRRNLYLQQVSRGGRDCMGEYDRVCVVWGETMLCLMLALNDSKAILQLFSLLESILTTSPFLVN